MHNLVMAKHRYKCQLHFEEKMGRKRPYSCVEQTWDITENTGELERISQLSSGFRMSSTFSTQRDKWLASKTRFITWHVMHRVGHLNELKAVFIYSHEQ